MLILFLALIALPASAPAKSPPPAKKSQWLEQLHKACVKNSFQEGKNQEAACECLRANYEKKLNEADLELLARVQNGTAAKTELEGKDDLLEFDMEASQHCVEDSAWRWVPVAKPKEEAKEGEEPAAKPAPKAKPAAKAQKSGKKAD